MTFHSKAYVQNPLFYCNCSVSNPSWWLMYLFLPIFQKQDSLLFMWTRLSIEDWSSEIQKPFVSTVHILLWNEKSDTKSFHSAQNFYIPLQHLCRTLQQSTYWCNPYQQKQSKWFCNHRKSLSSCPSIYHVQQNRSMQDYWIMEDLTDFK